MIKLRDIPLRVSFKSPFKSIVPDHKDSCFFTWRNENQIDNRLDGGVSGFFRKAESTFIPWVYKLSGKEFHGIVMYWRPDTVQSTERTDFD